MSLVAVLPTFLKTLWEVPLIKPLDIKYLYNFEDAANTHRVGKVKTSFPISCYLCRMTFQLGFGDSVPASVSLQYD